MALLIDNAKGDKSLMKSIAKAKARADEVLERTAMFTADVDRSGPAIDVEALEEESYMILLAEAQKRGDEAEDKVGRIKGEAKTLVDKIRRVVVAKEDAYKAALRKARERGNEAVKLIDDLKVDAEDAIERIRNAALAKEESYRAAIAKAEGRASDAEEWVARFEAETKAAIIKIKTAALAKEKYFRISIAKAENRAKEKAKLYAEGMARVKAEFGIKVVNIKAEANKAVAQEKSRAKKALRELCRIKIISNMGAGDDTPGFGRGKKESDAVAAEFAEMLSSYDGQDNLQKI